MITKNKKVYYCDHCKKHGLSAICISRHEKSCTNNPDRICRLCGRESIKTLIQKYQGSYKIIKDKMAFIGETIRIEWKDKKEVRADDILVDVESCPNCALTIMRTCGMTGYPFSLNFDYKKVLEDWWADKNAEEYDKERCDAVY